MKRKREELPFTPVWDKRYQQWTASFIAKNAWRCDPMDTPKDLMQEAWIIFDKVVTAYPRVVQPAHFFSLYKRALVNKFHDKSSAKNRRSNIQVQLSSEVSDFFLGRMVDISNEGYLAALVNTAPEEIKLALLHLSKTDGGSTRRNDPPPGRRENLSSRLQRLCNLPAGSDPVAKLKKLLST